MRNFMICTLASYDDEGKEQHSIASMVENINPYGALVRHPKEGHS
jgi:hypothetical protein